MREESEPLGLVVRDLHLTLAPELGNGFGHRLVEAPVEGAKLVGRDRRVQLDGQLGNGLADIPIIVDDLGRGEPDLLQGLAMLGRAQADLIVGGRRAICRFFNLQRRDELLQEQGNSGFQLVGGRTRSRPEADLRPAVRDAQALSRNDPVLLRRRGPGGNRGLGWNEVSGRD